MSWNTNGLRGTKKFLDKVVALWDKVSPDAKLPTDVEILFNQTIKKTTEDIDAFRFNTSIAQFMILVNSFTECEAIPTDVFEKFVILLAPFAPHLAEEFWSLLGHEFSIFKNAKWPKYDESKLSSDLVKMAVQFNGKVR
ncbi:class I tRNA ligase family protein [bacterium]|nr:class I tRNA ligase family protein [bacterium]